MGGQRLDRKPVGLAGNQIERASADRAGRAKDREAPGRRIGGGFRTDPPGSPRRRIGSA